VFLENAIDAWLGLKERFAKADCIRVCTCIHQCRCESMRSAREFHLEDQVI
jgi:hypothetical protein